MESKKKFASFMEDSPSISAAGPSSITVRPLSPFRSGRLGSSWVSSSHANNTGSPIDPSQPFSCVTRETYQEDCARHRFIVWAAVKRNSCSRMTAAEKLRCPLLRCNQTFPDHETMLRHLAACEHLESGEYLCYDHMRVERFDDVKCKRCLGHPSKRRRMLSMAKNFFHSLGHKSKKGHGFPFDPEDTSLPPPPYHSLNTTPQLASLTELCATANEILEIDSTEITMASTLGSGTGDAINPQALLVPELDSTALSSETYMNWHQSTPIMDGISIPISPMDESDMRSPGSSRPSLQLTTHGLQGAREPPRPAPKPAPVVLRSKGLSPSASVRSTASTNSNISATSHTSSLVSPMSNWSGAWSMASGFDTSLTSPVDLVSPVDFLSNNPFAESSGACSNVCPDFLHYAYSELPADAPCSKVSSDIAHDPLFIFDEAPVVNLSYASNLALTDDSTNLIDLEDTQVEESNVCCSETKSMVGSAWDALQEHIVSSTLKIQHVRGNPLADQLRSMSIKSIATAGLRTLRSLLAHNSPTSAIDTLCFIHLIYAFSLVIHEQDTTDRSKDLFLQSLSYATTLSPNERDLYNQLTYGIWQPLAITQEDVNIHFASSSTGTMSRSSSLKGKQPDISGHSAGDGTDALLLAARNFLDELEMSLILGKPPSSPEVQASDLYTKHLVDINPGANMNTPFSYTVNYIVTMLSGEYSDAEGLASNLKKVSERVATGEVSSVRRFEIELLHAGKGCMTSSRFFGVFVPSVRMLCNQLYQNHHETGSSRRLTYHNLGISLIETLILEFDSVKGAAPILDDTDDIDEFFNNLTVPYDQPQPEAYPNMDQLTCVPFENNTIDPSHLSGPGKGRMQVPRVTTIPPDEPNPEASSPSGEPAKSNTGQSTQQQSGQAPKVEIPTCDICGYRPKGDPQWYKGSMNKHMKLMHNSAPPKLYKCPYPGCNSQYKNRPDNLRQHQLEKNHFVEGEDFKPRRPSKRKKTSQEDD